MLRKKMKNLSLLALISLLSGCSVFSTKEYKIITSDAKSVASHNLSVLRYCNTNSENYLYVDKNFQALPRNVFVYINDLNQDLQKLNVCLKALEEYNLKVFEKYQQARS